MTDTRHLYIGLLLPLILASWNTVLADNTIPRFTTGDAKHEVRAGQQIRLPCGVENLGGHSNCTEDHGCVDYSVMWTKLERGNSRMLYVDQENMEQDTRVSLVHDTDDQWDLVIDDTEPYDSGEYVCAVHVETTVLELKHHVQVKVAPSISLDPDRNPYIVRPNESFQLNCMAKGNPTPEVVWTTNDGVLPNNGSEYRGATLFFVSATSEHSGTYQCSASNNVHPNAYATIIVDVFSPNGKPQFKPKVNTASGYVVAMPGTTLNISCDYDAQPTATASWLKDNFPVNFNDEHKRLYQSTTETILEFVNITENDYGTYVCRVQNVMGTEQREIHVSGRPGPPSIEVEGQYGNHISLRWTVQSSDKPSEYEIRYQPTMGAHWKKVIKYLKTEPAGPLTWSAAYVIDDVLPNTVYIIQVRARNDVGWGSYPKQYTEHKTGVKKSPTARSADAIQSDGGYKEFSKSGLSLKCDIVSQFVSLFVALLLLRI